MVAKQPFSSLPMMLFFFYMMGNGISIYTIMFSLQFAIGPFKQLFSVNEVFSQFEHKDLNLLMPKLMFIAANALCIGVGLYKFSSMGIIPVQPADWAGLYKPNYAYEAN